MYKRLSAVLFPIVTLALIGFGVWGYQENQEKNSILIKAENNYQRSFHDLSYYMDRLHTELGNTIAVNSTSQQFYRKGLINVWRLTTQAQNEINRLPLTLLPFNKTEELLDNLSKFSYRTAVRDLSKNPMTPDEMNTLSTLYDRSKEITQELRTVQGQVLAQNLRWMDVEVALASEKKSMDNSIIDGFKMVDKKVSEYSEVEWGPSMASVKNKKGIHLLSENDATPDDIKLKAAEFLGVQDTSGLNVVETGAGTDYDAYSVTGKKPGTQEDVQMDFAKKGGKLLWFVVNREIKQKSMDIRQARDTAHQFIDTHGYANMVPIGYDEYHNIGNIAFARKQGDTIIYPEKMSVSVALDNGEITGLNVSDYVVEHKERQLNKPALSYDEAKKQLNPKFDVTSHALALITNDIEDEVLCHQFIGKINGSTYKIFVNADTGYEEKIETTRNMEAAKM